MRADEHEPQAFVGKSDVEPCQLLRFVGHREQRRQGFGMHAFMARAVDQSPPRRSEQPRFGLVGHATLRPRLERGLKRVGKRVLRRRDVAGACGQKRDQPTIGVARRPFDGTTRVHARRVQMFLSSSAAD